MGIEPLSYQGLPVVDIVLLLSIEVVDTTQQEHESFKTGMLSLFYQYITKVTWA